MNRLLAGLVLCGQIAWGSAFAQYPSKPVRLIVGFPPGGSADAVARVVAQALAPGLGQPVIVENRPGAESATAAEQVTRAAPDGYTLFYGSSNSMTAPAALRKVPPYDPTADFTPISLIGDATLFLCLHPSVPATTLAEFISYARANPGKLNFGTGNPLAHLQTTALMKSADISMLHIPYKGEAPAILDLIAGRVQLGFITTTSVLGHAKEGKLRLLAVALDERSPLAPATPTLAEVGMPEPKLRAYAALFGPPRLPRDIVERLSRELNAQLKITEVRAQLQRQGYFVRGSTPEGLAAVVRENIASWKQAVRDAGLTLE